MAATQQKLTKQKRPSGVRGHTGRKRGRAKETGAFMGDAALSESRPGAVHLRLWEFLTARTPWKEPKMMEYLQEWLNENHLLHGQADVAAFGQLVNACMSIQRVRARLAKVKPAPPDDFKKTQAVEKFLSYLSDEQDKWWSRCYRALSHMDLKSAKAKSSAADLNEQELAKFES